MPELVRKVQTQGAGRSEGSRIRFGWCVPSRLYELELERWVDMEDGLSWHGKRHANCEEGRKGKKGL